jgi:hypothetical protein
MSDPVIMEPATYFAIDVPITMLAASPLFAGAIMLVGALSSWPVPTKKFFTTFHLPGIMDWVVYETYHNGLFPFFLALILWAVSFAVGLRPWTGVYMATAIAVMLEYKYLKWKRDMYGTA